MEMKTEKLNKLNYSYIEKGLIRKIRSMNEGGDDRQ